MENDTLDEILDALTVCARDTCAKPWASGLVRTMTGFDRTLRNGWMEESGSLPEIGAVPPPLAAKVFQIAHIVPGDIEQMNFSIRGGTVRTVVSSDFGEDLHGRVVRFDGETLLLGNRDMMAAEALLSAVQVAVEDRLRMKGDREFRRIRFMMSGMGDEPVASSVKTFMSDNGLRKNRYATLIDALVAKCRTEGLRRDVGPDLRPHCDLRSASVATRELMSRRASEPFLFIEVDRAMGLSDARDFARSLERLMSAGLMPMPPEDFGLVLRVRRFSGASYGAHYASAIREIVIPVDNPGLFTHEYAHAMDHFMGRPSGKHDFDAISSLYGTMIAGRVPEDRIQYYGSRNEVFARTFEIFVTMRVRYTPCCRIIYGSDVHPRSPELDLLIDRYFGKLLGTT